jgi:hypothetical protein
VASQKTASLSECLCAQVITRDGKTNEEIVAEIRQIAGDNLTRPIDLVGPSTADYCLQALSMEKQCLLAPLPMMKSDVKVPNNVTVETVEMKRFVLDEESRGHALELNRLLGEGLFRLPNIEIIGGGLDVVQEGLKRLKGGDMVGRKMLVSME